VGDGLTDFTPSPEESRAIIRAGYACPATLLVQFENDSFDETPEMQQLLTERQAGSSTTTPAAPLQVSADPTISTTGAGGAAAAVSSVPQSGYTSAWNSIDEDVSMDNLLQQLQELQASLQLQEQQRQQQPAGLPELQQLLLPGSHITPCGAQLQGSLGPSPFDLLLSNTSGPGSQADLQNLAQKVLNFLDGRRPVAAQRRTAMQQQQQQQPVPVPVSSGGSADSSASMEASADAEEAAAVAMPGRMATGTSL